MTTIINSYIGITHPITDDLLEKEDFCKAWKKANCVNGIHLFDECWSLEEHFLHCDVCGMDVYIDKIVIPDGKDHIIENKKEKK